MKIEGAFTFAADVETVWDHMLDPNALSACLPGCERFEPTGEDSYDVVMRVGVAGISGRYTGKVTVADVQHGESYKMIVQGRGRGGGIRGEGVLTFAADGEGTRVTVDGDARVTGVVARVGQRLLGTVSKTLMTQFFTCMAENLEASA